MQTPLSGATPRGGPETMQDARSTLVVAAS